VHQGPVRDLRFDATGEQLVSAADDWTAALRRARDGAVVHELVGTHTAPVTGADFTPDGQRLATACADSSVRLWDTATGREILSLREHEFGVGGLRFGTATPRLYSIGREGVLRGWIPLDWSDPALGDGTDRHANNRALLQRLGEP
jgi:WD40 repeat protein